MDDREHLELVIKNGGNCSDDYDCQVCSINHNLCTPITALPKAFARLAELNRLEKPPEELFPAIL